MTEIKNIYFIGIGGIGMSALALYFLEKGLRIAGYDKTETDLTRSLSVKGCDITYKDNTDSLPPVFRDPSAKRTILAIYTPAVPHDNAILSYFRNNGYTLQKRSAVLGEISRRAETVAVAGTHGKTTVSTMIAHLLKQSHIGCSAFLGGISKNYDSNYLPGQGRYTVMEADEFDRSFHSLSPLIAVITSADADHLDIYGDRAAMIEAYREFCLKIRKKGKLLINSNITELIRIPEWINTSTYGSTPGTDYRAENIKLHSGCYSFNLCTPSATFYDIHFPFPGKINVENITAASAVALICGVKEEELRNAILKFEGVKRRFDIRVDMPGLTYIDDYAHHPEEIKACISSVREYFSGRKITGIFQPHLYSRTRDHADGFAKALDLLDEVILLPLYPAREEPIPGITSEVIFSKMKTGNKKMLSMDELPEALDLEKLSVLVTIGAGDIDRLVKPIEDKLKSRRRA